MLFAVLTLPAVFLLAFPARALAAADLEITKQGPSGTGADDVIDETISDKPLPPTGGPSLLGLAVVALGLSVGGACVVGAGVRRRDR